MFTSQFTPGGRGPGKKKGHSCHSLRPRPPPQAGPSLTRGARRTAAQVFVHQVEAFAPVAAGLAAALIHLALAARARVAGRAGAGEAGDAVHAAPVMARVRGAVVHVALAQRPLEACRAQASGKGLYPSQIVFSPAH